MKKYQTKKEYDDLLKLNHSLVSKKLNKIEDTNSQFKKRIRINKQYETLIQ